MRPGSLEGGKTIDRMKLPSPLSLRAELDDDEESGPHNQSVVKFGCEGCSSPGSNRFVLGRLSVGQLIKMTDAQTGLPFCAVSGTLEAIGKARGCEKDPETDEPNCEHKDELITVMSRIHRPPDKF